MELLAPAGSVDHFIAALEAGADAVYVGAPFLSARNPARELRLEEIDAMVAHARDLDKRVYIALNSLVKETDLPQLIRTLSHLEEINPHALIVQDLGVIELVRRYFRSLNLHASTLVFAHGDHDIRQLADLGCSRVVLARELSLKEIAKVVRHSPVDIEVFVHGAMCFSYSGRCLFSSYHGGKSGLRGKCVQPCRRKFTIGGAGGGARGRKGTAGSGYVFSMNDLEAIDFIDDFKKIGVASIKIEGRLKPVSYVRSVVGAYRMVLDAGRNDLAEARKNARTMLEESPGRKRSTGYFLNPVPKDAITAGHSGNIGTHLGVINGVTHDEAGNWVMLTAKEPCREGDRVRLHFEVSGERAAFTVKTADLQDDGQTAILLPGTIKRKQLRGKIELYRVDTVAARRAITDVTTPPLEIPAFSAAYDNAVAKRSKSVLNNLGPARKPAQGQNRRESKQKQRVRPSEIWVRFDTVKPLYQKLPFSAERFIIPINKQTLAETGHLSRYFGKNRNRVIWGLPPVVYDQRRASLQRDIQVLIRSGFRSFQISTLGQIGLFNEKNISLYGDYSLNVLNSRAMQLLLQRGLAGFQFSIETDRDALKRAVASFQDGTAGQYQGRTGKQGAMIGLTVYGAPALFMSRVHAAQVSFRQKVVSPKQEAFVVQKSGGETFTRPERPFSLLPFKRELEAFGLDYLVIDLSGLGSDRKMLQVLAKRVHGKERTAKLPTFNYDGHLE